MFLEKIKKIVFWSLIIVIIISLFSYGKFGENFDMENLRFYINNFGVLAPIIFIIIYTITTIFLPSTPFMALAGVLFGFKFGLLYTIIGGLLSSLILFAISRKLGKSKIDQILENKYLKYISKYNKRLEHNGIIDLIILRILPIMPFNVLNIIMGISGIQIDKYIIGTIIGLAPSNVLAVYFGYLIFNIF